MLAFATSSGLLFRFGYRLRAIILRELVAAIGLRLRLTHDHCNYQRCAPIWLVFISTRIVSQPHIVHRRNFTIGITHGSRGTERQSWLHRHRSRAHIHTFTVSFLFYSILQLNEIAFLIHSFTFSIRQNGRAIVFALHKRTTLSWRTPIHRYASASELVGNCLSIFMNES